MSEHLGEFLGGRVKVELDLSNYVTKADLKFATIHQKFLKIFT